MKRITDITAFGELASARDGLGDITNQLYAFYVRAKNDESTEGLLLAHTIHDVRQQLCELQKKLADMAACYH